MSDSKGESAPLSPKAKNPDLEKQIEAMLQRLTYEQLELLQTMIEERLATWKQKNSVSDKR